MASHGIQDRRRGRSTDPYGDGLGRDRKRRLPVIPLGAVVQSESGPFVYRQVTPGTFEPVAVTLGVRREQQVAVLTGLQEGDQIVVGGSMLLEGSGKTEP